MHYCERQVEEWRHRVRKGEGEEEAVDKGKEKPVLDPVEIMQKGYEKCIECVQNEVSCVDVCL